MQINEVDINEIKKSFQMSEELYKSISKAKQEILNLHKLAGEEIDRLKRTTARDEIQDANHSRIDYILNKTAIHLYPHQKYKIKSLLMELYLNKNAEKLINRLKDESITSDYHSIIKNSPHSIQLWGVIWRFTNKKKKQDILESVQKVDQFIKTYSAMNETINTELYPSLELSEEILWQDYKNNERDYYEGIKRLHNTDKALVLTDDYEEHKRNFKELELFKNQIEKTFHEKERSIHLVANLIKTINKEQVEKELRNTSIDEFRQLYPDSSLRLHLLAQSGITTVGEMNDYSTFLSIPGIGSVTNDHIQIALAHYKDEVNKSIAFHFEPENKTNSQKDILRNLYLKVNDIELSKEIEQVQLQYFQLPFDSLLGDIFIQSEWAMQQLAKNEKLFKDYKFNSLKLKDFMKKHESLVDDYANALKKISTLSEYDIWSDFNTHAADYYAVLEREFGVGSANVQNIIKRSGLSEDIIRKVNEFKLNEDGLNATLRSWQDFGTKYSLLQKKVLVGDEMGLGKTLISIASMVHLTEAEERNYYIVICPASIMENWERELAKFSKLRAYKAHGTYRDEIFNTWKQMGGVAITTYETSAVLDFSDVDTIDMITVDEAHYIKNPQAKRTINVRHLTDRSDYALYLTGTPLENKVGEMTQLIKPLAPEIAQSLSRPRLTLNSNQYRQEIAPVYLRRTKKDVSLELPPLTQIEEWEQFGEEEFKEYKDAVENGKFMRMRRAAWSGSGPSKSPKLKRLLELTEEAYENNSKVIVFSFFRDVIETIVDALGDRVVDPIHGGVPIGRRQEIIDEYRKSKTKNVLVAQINTAAHGLNIQFANTIIFCEPQIKPSLESQAVARAYRMGQVNNVFVYRLLTVNSIDELMLEMLGNKQALFDEFADRSYILEELKEWVETDNKEEKNIQNKIIYLESARLGIEKSNKNEVLQQKAKKG